MLWGSGAGAWTHPRGSGRAFWGKGIVLRLVGLVVVRPGIESRGFRSRWELGGVVLGRWTRAGLDHC